MRQILRYYLPNNLTLTLILILNLTLTLTVACPIRLGVAVGFGVVNGRAGQPRRRMVVFCIAPR